MNAEIEAKAQEMFQRYDLDALDFARWLAELWAMKCHDGIPPITMLDIDPTYQNGIIRGRQLCAALIRDDVK